MKKLIILALALTGLSGLLVSCKSKQPVDKTVLHVHVGSHPETLDPTLADTTDSTNVILHAFEGLIKIDQNNNVVAGLAESWEESPDGLTWIFHLRDNLKWSDGSDLTAEDFVYSWKRLINPKTAASRAYDFFNMVKGFEQAFEGDVDKLAVSAPDKRTLVVELAYPCTYFDKILTMTNLVPLQKATIEADGEAWATKPETYICNGPYYMTEFSDDSQIVLTKNPYYWDAQNITFNQIVWHLIDEEHTCFTAYNQDLLQMTIGVPVEEIESIDEDDLHIEPIMGSFFITFNTQRKPFDNPLVRQALSLAIDRNYIAYEITGGIYSPAKNLIGPGISDAEQSSSFEEVTSKNYGDFFALDKYNAELKKAKDLLAEAGYPDGKGFPTFEYMTYEFGANILIAEYLQASWAQLGLTMKINIQEWQTVTANLSAGNFDLAENNWAYDWDDPSNILNTLETNNGNNDGMFSSEELDKVLKLARESQDIKSYYKYLHEAEKIILKEAAVAPYAYINDFWLQKPNLKNSWHSPYGLYYFMYGYLE